MKTKRIWKKLIAQVLATVMLVSIFSTVDMGWNVMEVKAQTYNNPYNQLNAGDKLNAGDTLNCEGSSSHTKVSVTINNGAAYQNAEYTLPEISADKCCYKIKEIYADSTVYIILDVLNHSYETTYTWSANGKSCTAKRTCSYSASHVESETATITSAPKIPATCTTKGTTTYTATFSKSAFSKQTKDVQDINALNHDWSDTTWKKDETYHWNACKNDSSHIQNKAVHSGGEATCTAKAKCSICNAEYGELAGHSFSYYGSGDTITAICGRSGCPYDNTTNGITLTLSADEKEYTGSPYIGASIGSWSVSPKPDGLVDPPVGILYKQGETTLEGAPTNVGHYTASITVNGETATKGFDITKKAIAEGDLTVTRENATYDGEKKEAVFELNGVSNTGDISLTYQKKNDDDSWGPEDSEAPKNAGTYQVVAYVTGGDNLVESHAAVKEF